MALSAGTRLGAYEVLSALGAGGMGEVYRARDSRLGRDVALKILPESLARDPGRLARFRREAQVLAALNHPHIAAIYGIEDAGDTRCLVLELVDGETLQQRIARGPLPPAEALAIAAQVAVALEAAHEKGIVHRDLKPANIALTRDGEVKVLDFGLAKVADPPLEAASDLVNSPTLTSPAIATGAGVILGTAAYMSPEQAKGRPADKRSDIWAFGCVLFEMLTGRRAFEGEDVSDTLAAVLRGDPDWGAWPPTLPPAIRALVEGTLKKDRRERISDISTALFVLRWPDLVAPVGPVRESPRRRVWERAALVLIAMAIGAAIAVATLRGGPTPRPAPTRFAITLPGTQLLTLNRPAVTISPDGTKVAYAGDGRLYLRAMSEFDSKVVGGTDGAVNPVFSPDGQWLVFFADSALRRIAVSGGAPVTICQTAPAPIGMTWSTHGILFVEPGTGVLQVSPEGGKPQLLVGVDQSDSMFNGPQLLPDGRTLLFTVAQGSVPGSNRWDRARIVVQSLDTGERKTLIDGGTDARYVSTGHIVYLSAGVLLAVPFDLSTLRVTAGSVPVVEGVRRSTTAASGGGQFAFSNSGTLVYLPGPVSGSQFELVVFDRQRSTQTLNLPPGPYRYPRVSPDGTRLAFETNAGQETIIAVYDLSGASAVRRLTFGGNSRFPVWSADGRRIAFQSDRDGDLAVFWQSADGGTAERLTRADRGTSHVPESWSPRGDTLLFSVAKGTEVSLWMLSLPDRKTAPLDDVRSAHLPTNAAFSPDGRWVAYQIGDPGVAEATTFVQPFPPSGTKYQIGRGGRPLWSRDGTELFYVPAPGQFMAVTVRTRPSFSFTNPVAVPRLFGAADPASPRPFDLLPDGRFVGAATLGQGGATGRAEIRVVLNWFEELRARAPGE